VRTALAITAVALAFALPQPVAAEEGEGGIVASTRVEDAAEVDAEEFTLVILGTRKAGDIEVIRRNLRDLPYVTLLIPTSVSQRHLEFSGRLAGDEATLIADIESLSADRYDVVAKRDRRRGLVITLRKISDPMDAL
jgi:hypothetical protein